MNRFQVEPDPLLLPYVESYWGVARGLSVTGGFTITPDRFMELVFFVNPPSVARFRFVRHTLWTQPRKELAASAFEAGYADQAHLTQHFRRYTDQTPGGFLRHNARLRAALGPRDAQDVAILQDGS